MPVSLVATRFRLRTIGALEADNVPIGAEEHGLLYNASKKDTPTDIVAIIPDNEYILNKLRIVRRAEDKGAKC